MKKIKKIIILASLLGIVGTSLAFGTLRKAVDAYNKGDYLRASELFYELSQKKVSPDLVDRFNIFLANSLFKGKLYQSSVEPLLRIIKRKEASLYFISAVRKLIFLFNILHDPNILAELANIKTTEYPYIFSDNLYYLTGRYYYDKGETENALKYLSQVPDNSPFFHKSKYITALIQYFNNNPRDALEALRELIEIFGFGNDINLEDETYIATARILYSIGRFEKAIEFYSAIPKNSRQWPQALYESTWALFLSGNYNKALGQLLALTSPYFSHVLIHEMYIIEAIIYYDLCQYSLSELSIDGYHAMYDHIAKEAFDLLAAYKASPVNFANILRQEKNYGFSYMLENFLNSDPYLSEERVNAKKLQQEIDAIEKSDVLFRMSPFGKDLYSMLKQKKTQVMERLGKNGIGVLENLQIELADLASKADIIKFETLNEEKAELARKRVIDEEFEDLVALQMKKYGKVKGTKLFPAKEFYYWPFPEKGEFWVDELDSYLFSLEKTCK